MILGSNSDSFYADREQLIRLRCECAVLVHTAWVSVDEPLERVIRKQCEILNLISPNVHTTTTTSSMMTRWWLELNQFEFLAELSGKEYSAKWPHIFPGITCHTGNTPELFENRLLLLHAGLFQVITGFYRDIVTGINSSSGFRSKPSLSGQRIFKTVTVS